MDGLNILVMTKKTISQEGWCTSMLLPTVLPASFSAFKNMYAWYAAGRGKQNITRAS